MVDYSKWNNFDLDSTDSDSEEDNGVRVTKLDQPSKITTSKNGDVVIENQPKVKTKSINALMNKSSSVVGQMFEFDDMPSPPPPPPPKSLQIALKPKNGASYDQTTPNTNSNTKLFWDQDSTSITVHAVLPPNTATKSIKITLTGNINTWKTRNESTTTNNTDLSGRFGGVCVSVQNENENENDVALFGGEFSFPIFVGTEEDEEDLGDSDVFVSTEGGGGSSIRSSKLSSLVDWEVLTFGTNDRVLKLTFGKSSPMNNIVIWWDKLFSNDDGPKIDLGEIEGRKKQAGGVTNYIGSGSDRASGSGSGSGSTGGKDIDLGTDASSAWEEAHRMFKDKMKKKKKMEQQEG